VRVHPVTLVIADGQVTFSHLTEGLSAALNQSLRFEIPGNGRKKNWKKKKEGALSLRNDPEKQTWKRTESPVAPGLQSGW
jgi:hypothetical protein